MNHNQSAIVGDMVVNGWHILKQGENVVMALGGKVAVIRPDRSMEIVRDGGTATHFCYVQAYKGRGWTELSASIATAAAKTNLTSEQFGDILHAIGGGANGYTRPGYRNRYTVNDRKPSLDALVEGGFMTYHKGETMGVYHVTPKGAAEVGCAGCLERDK